ncbi:MAG: rRNA pseudouridine synthase [Candidatus Omnitrophica bacterium]|nr:rRNA pseudouridine synthase [Candidatus Omnitrophota bacterium]
MRLQVFLSHSGTCSRRAAVNLIRTGRVSVNKQPIYEASYAVDPDKDRIFLDGRSISLKKKVYILFNKPKGVVTTRQDKHAKVTVYEHIPKDLYYLYPVGRLDKDSQGLLIFTNDGEFAHRLMHPRFGVKKKYLLRIDQDLSNKDKSALEKGIILDSKRTSCADIVLKDRRNLTISIHEGKKRQIRRMFSHLGYNVVFLKRVSYGVLKLGSLPEARWRNLTKKETDALFRCVGMAV